MAVRKILIWPDPALRQVAKPVKAVDDEIRELIDDLFDTMYKANGVGLAATQIAVNKRVLVIDLDPNQHGQEDPEQREELESWGYTGPLALINPQIISHEGDIIWEEGCLSVPGIVEAVKRFEHVTVQALNKQGQTFEISASGLFSVALQHEMDHLDGKDFVEYLSKVKRDVIKRKMTRMKTSETDDGVEAAAAL
ncbi:MAG: peptide deformylase [Myxococcota bacterium]